MRACKAIDIAILASYVALIYATLPVMPKIFLMLSNILRSRLSIFINTSLAVVGLSVMLLFRRTLKKKRPMAWLGLAAVILIYALLLTVYTPIASEKIHLLEYGVVGYLGLRVFRDIRSKDLRYLCVIAAVTIIGCFDEFIQAFLPNRVCEASDVYLNILCGLLALVFFRLVGYEDGPSPDLC